MRPLGVLGLLLVVLLTGCVRVVDEPDARPLADARSVVDGRETWDLRGTPSDEAFGRAAGASAAVYPTREPRPVRLVLPGDRVLVLADVVLVDFKAFGGDEPSRWSFGVTTAGGDLATTTRVLREQLAALGLPTGVADDLTSDGRGADGPESVASPFQKTRLGDLGIGVRATWSPRTDRGVVDVAGDWGAAR